MSLKNFLAYIGFSVLLLYLNLTPLVKEIHGFVSVFTNPVAFFYSRTYNDLQDFYHLLSNVSSVQVENKKLKKEITKLKGELSLYKKIYDENFFVKEQKTYYGSPNLIYADIIGRDLQKGFYILTLNIGLKKGVLEKDNVAYNGYAVGFIKSSTPFKSLVVAVDSPKLKIPAVSLQYETSGLFACSENACVVENILQDKPLKEGDIFVTSGIEGIFKKGLVLGTVESIESKKQDIFKKAFLIREISIKDLNKVVILKYE